jgi:hypothetical protein
MLNGTYSGTLKNAVDITSTNLRNKNNVTGFDFVNIWTIDTSISGEYPYPVLIGNQNTHDIVITYKTEGVEFIDGENAKNGGTIVDKGNGDKSYYYINENSSNIYAISETVKPLHDDILTIHNIEIKANTNYHITKITLDGVVTVDSDVVFISVNVCIVNTWLVVLSQLTAHDKKFHLLMLMLILSEGVSFVSSG